MIGKRVPPIDSTTTTGVLAAANGGVGGAPSSPSVDPDGEQKGEDTSGGVVHVDVDTLVRDARHVHCKREYLEYRCYSRSFAWNTNLKNLEYHLKNLEYAVYSSLDTPVFQVFMYSRLLFQVLFQVINHFHKTACSSN